MYLNVILLLDAVLLVGCLGGSGTSSVTDEQTIHSLLNRYQTAMKGMDAEGIANLFSYPIELDGEILEDKEHAILIFSFVFELIHIHEYELKDREVIIDSSGTDATIEGIIFNGRSQGR